ncbi:MAG: LysM domain-containing protein, partial [Chloroflexota bacterium]
MRRFLVCLILLLILVACGQSSQATPDLATAVPYHPATPSLTPTLIPGLTEIILPTPTIFTYAVAANDTLIGIAQRYGVTLEALVAANPGVQPTALTVGTELVIPTGSEISGEPTPTPAAPAVLQARCWPELDGGLWCFALVRNDYAETLENLSAQFTLSNASGRELASQIVYGLLDILPPGASMPLAAHFAPPAPADAGLRAQVLTAIRLLPGDVRYLPVMLENTLVSVEASGRSAQVSGRVILTGAGTANTLWVLATAYDGAGNVIGVRR